MWTMSQIFLQFGPNDELCVTTPQSFLAMRTSCWKYVNDADLQYLEHLKFITSMIIVKNTREI